MLRSPPASPEPTRPAAGGEQFCDWVCARVFVCVGVCLCTCMRVCVCMHGPAKYDGERPPTWQERRCLRRQFNILKKKKVK